jgi:glutathione S-transferase
MVIGVLFRTMDLGLLEDYSNLRAYVSRGEERPAFRRGAAGRFHGQSAGVTGEVVRR